VTIVYKLTDRNGYTRKGHSNETKWGEGITHRAKGSGGLCSSGCIHAYTSPELAVLLNPIHAAIPNPLMFMGEMDITHRDNSDMKVGGKSLTTDKQIPLPDISTRQRVIFAILCADAVLDLSAKHMPPKAIEKLADWRRWRDDYISGKIPANAARAAARAAAYAADAARAAADADYAAYAARAAAYAADAAAKNPSLDLADIARRAIELGK
jgi:hypothetical protein